MQEIGMCPGKNLIFTPAEGGQIEFRCLDTGRILKTFEGQDEATGYILALIRERGPWGVT